MFQDLLIATLAGILAGIFTGLTPGIHINLVSVVLVSLSPFLLQYTSVLPLCVFIVSMSVTHTFLDAIPSIFFGAPDADMVLGVLPGHRLLLEGRGYEAVKLTVIGSLLSLIATILIMPFMIPLIPIIYSLISPYMGYILIAAVVFMIYKEKGLIKILWAAFIFLLSGVLGILVLNWPNLKEPLFPLLSGLFGISTLLISFSQKATVPKQHITESIEIGFMEKVKAIGAAVISGSIAGLMPGLGSAQAAILAMQVVRNLGVFSFLILVGGINTVNFAFSLVTLYTLQKARNGAIVAVMELLESATIMDLAIFVAASLVAGGIASILTLKLSKIFSRLMEKVNYGKLCLSIIIFITLMAAYFGGLTGLFILVTSTAVGIIPALVGVKRSMSMGCLLLPVILFFVL